MDENYTKQCSTCQEEKSLDEYHRNSRVKRDGRASKCKQCCRDYYQENRQHILDRNKAWQESNAEVYSELKARWAKDNRDKINERKRQRYLDSQEYRDRAGKWNRDNPERVREIKKGWKKRNPDKVLEAKQRRNALKKGLTVEKVDYEEIRKRDDTCYLCLVPFTDEERWNGELTHVDHKVPLSRSELHPTHSYDNCALTHASCNLSKSNKTPEEYLTQS